MGAGSTGDEGSAADEAEDGETGSETDAGGASGVRHKRRRRRPRPPCFHATPPGDYHPGCKSCVKADWCKPPEIDSYAGGKLQLLGTPGANATMKGYLDDMAKTPTGGRILGILKELVTGTPVRIGHVDPETLKKFFPREMPAKPADMGKVVGDLAWTMQNQSNFGSAQSWHVVSDLGPTGDDKTLLPSPVVPGSKASSGSLVVYWEINVLSDIYHMPPPDNPGSVWIGHELVHVIHALRGEMLSRYAANDPFDPGDGDNEEEARTIGLTWWHKEELSENAIRRDLGLNTRVSHNGFVDSGARGNNRPVQ